MKKFLISLILIFGLSACASQQPTVITKVETQEVKVLVPVLCIKKELIPKPIPQEYPFKKTDKPQEKLRDLLIERNNRIIYESQLEALIKACTDKNNSRTDGQ
jgi:hypothetical protein